MTTQKKPSIVVGARVRGRKPPRQRQFEPFPEELDGVEGTVVPDGTLGHWAIDSQHVQVMFEGLDHPVSCARWELEAV